MTSVERAQEALGGMWARDDVKLRQVLSAAVSPVEIWCGGRLLMTVPPQEWRSGCASPALAAVADRRVGRLRAVVQSGEAVLVAEVEPGGAL